MLALRLLEAVLMITVVYGVATQILIPMWFNKPYFPILREKSRKLDRERREVMADLDDASLEGEISSLRAKAENVRGIEQILAQAERDLDNALTEGDIEEITRATTRVRGVESDLAKAKDDLSAAQDEVRVKDFQVKAKQQRAAI